MKFNRKRKGGKKEWEQKRNIGMQEKKTIMSVVKIFMKKKIKNWRFPKVKFEKIKVMKRREREKKNCEKSISPIAIWKGGDKYLKKKKHWIIITFVAVNTATWAGMVRGTDIVQDS